MQTQKYMEASIFKTWFGIATAEDRGLDILLISLEHDQSVLANKDFDNNWNLPNTNKFSLAPICLSSFKFQTLKIKRDLLIRRFS